MLWDGVFYFYVTLIIKCEIRVFLSYISTNYMTYKGHCIISFILFCYFLETFP